MRVVYYKTLLNDKEKEAYDKIGAALSRCEKEVVIYGLDCKTVTKIANMLMLDWPELFYVSREINYSYTSTYVIVQLNYVMSKDEADAKMKKIDSVADGILKKIGSMSDYEKALYIHDYLANNLIYDLQESKTEDIYSLAGALLNGRCVCDGYSKAYQYLCGKVGIPCIRVVGHGTDPDGKMEKHAWNMIKLDGVNYFVDVTYDKKSSKPCCSRAYFLLSTQQIKEDHIFDPEYKLPLCTQSRCPLPVVRSMAELKSKLMQEYRANKVASEIKFVSPVNTQQCLDVLRESVHDDEIDMYNSIKGCYYAANFARVSTIIFLWR